MAHSTAIVLAAGTSTRMGEENKLLLPLGDGSVLSSVVSSVCASSIDDVVVVTGHQDRQIRDELAGYRVRIAYNPEYEAGMSTSIRRGVLACTPGTSRFMICLGDMPFVNERMIDQLLERARSTETPSIVVTTYEGRRGHPVVFDRAFKPELMALTGDVGARSIIEAHPEVVIGVEVSDGHVMDDIDTWEAYSEARVS